MSLGRQQGLQSDLLLSWSELPRSAGHPFYDELQAVLRTADFDPFVEGLCKPYYSSSPRGRRSLPPGRYFRMLLVGYFEGLHSERGIEWRCADSLSLREFLLLSSREAVPDHSWLSKTRSRLPLETHEAVFTWVLAQLAEHGLIKGDRIGVDASTMEANAALRAIVHRDSGEGYREMLQRLAKESGIETPTADDLIRLDRKRKGKKLSNEDWASPSDPDARIAKMKDGRTRLGYKPEHAVDLDTGAIVAAPVHGADQGDTKTLPDTLETVEVNLEAVGKAPSPKDPAELVADKGYHSRRGLKGLEDGSWMHRRLVRAMHGSASPNKRASIVGRATTTPNGRSTTTATGYSRRSPAKPSSCAPNWSNEASRSPWIEAACEGPGYAAVTMSKNAT